MPNIHKDIRTSELLGQDAKCVISHILGHEKSKKAQNILKDFRADIVLKDIFDFASASSIGLLDDFADYEKIFNYLAAESPAFARYSDRAIVCANHNEDLSKIILPLVFEHRHKLDCKHIQALTDGWCYESDLRADMIAAIIRQDKNPRKSAEILGKALSRISYKQHNPFVKSVTQAFTAQNAKDGVSLNIFSDALLSPALKDNSVPDKTTVAAFKQEIRKIPDTKVQKMALFALDGKNAEDVRQIYHDDFLSCAAEKLIKITATLPDANPDFMPLTVKVLESTEKESAEQHRHGVLLYLAAAAAGRPKLTEALLPVFEKNDRLPFAYVGNLFFSAVKSPALSGRIMKIIKASLRSDSFSSQGALSGISPVSNVLNPFNIKSPEAFELIYTYLNDAKSDMNQMHVFCKDCLHKLGHDCADRPETRNIIRTMHRNKILRSNPKDFAVFMADLESFKIENAYDSPLNDYINDLKARTPVKALPYIKRLLNNSLEYKENFNRLKKEFPDYQDINDDYIYRQPERHEAMTLQEVEKSLNENKLSLIDKTKIYLQLRQFEHYALPQSQEYCRQVAKGLSLNPFYAKSVAFAKFNLFNDGKQALKKVWKKNER